MKVNPDLTTALINLENNSGIKGQWFDEGYRDGQLTLNVVDRTLKFNVELRTEVSEHQLDWIIEDRIPSEFFMLVALKIAPKAKQLLREKSIAYLEGNGNIFLSQPNHMLWIDTAPPLKIPKKTGNRAFTKTGLKVIFRFLANRELVNQTQRHIAAYTGVALGNIPLIINGLKDTGYLANLNETTYLLEHSKELLDHWVQEYSIKLRPTLYQGRFMIDDDLYSKTSGLGDKGIFWGGEAGGDMITNHLRPEEFIIYTRMSNQELIRRYKFKPDPLGNLSVYTCFWEEINEYEIWSLLIYTDLMIKGDKRCRETAKIIFNEHLTSII